MRSRDYLFFLRLKGSIPMFFIISRFKTFNQCQNRKINSKHFYNKLFNWLLEQKDRSYMYLVLRCLFECKCKCDKLAW